MLLAAGPCALAAIFAVFPGDGVCQQAEAEAEAPTVKLPKMMDKRTADAIRRGLDYLARAQRQDGSWLSSGRYGSYPSAMTSLAAMAFMAGGSTPEEGPYKRQVKKAMNFCIRVAKIADDGFLTAPTGGGRSMYGHGFTMLFLGQCYGMQATAEQGHEIERLLTMAAAVTSEAQSDLGDSLGNAGGWYYTPDSDLDEGSVTVTQLQALRACRNAGIRVDKRTIDRAVAYLKYCQMPDGGICYSSRSRGSSRPAISAAAIACFYAAGVYDRQAGGAGEEAEMVEKLIEYCRKRADPSRPATQFWFYTQFYYAQAMYHRGGEDWEAYYPKVRDRLLEMQTPDGNWFGDSIGSVYGTALATIILQLPYGYLPICQR
ncbi:MAG: prenyltransferase/squalene oxidase repeat-containing protein [Planctomycetota bacterium]